MSEFVNESGIRQATENDASRRRDEGGDGERMKSVREGARHENTLHVGALSGNRIDSLSYLIS